MSIEESLPPRQKEVLSLIAQLTEECGYPPTLAELAKSMGLRNRMTVHQHVAALKKKGLVRWEPGLNRSLRLVSPEPSDIDIGEMGNIACPEAEPIGEPIKGIPLAGAIAAGQPIDAVQTDEYLEVEAQYCQAGCFALRIKGDSMIEDGIWDGDYVIVKPNPSPRNGEIVVATLEDGTATLKRLYKEDGRFRLQPANQSMAPIFVDGSNDLTVQGVVVALFRKLS